MKVFIDPRARISYASFYIEGLFRLLGKAGVKFEKKYFADLIQSNGKDDFEHYFAFVVAENFAIKKIVIDYRDKNTLNMDALTWADIYGKVNYNKAVLLESGDGSQNHKIVPIGPNFGIRIWNNHQTFFNLIKNYLNCSEELPVSLRDFMSGYNWQRKRPRYDSYKQSLSEGDYIFFQSTLYGKRENASQVNRLRAAFIRACKSTVSNFEGGLLAKPQYQEFRIYKDVLAGKYFKPSEYLHKVKKSAVAFNTPAAWGCLGWKLGEFLALGKAIISTPLLNEMPFPFEHGKHVHFVHAEKDIKCAVEKVVNDRLYRQQLEQGARAYFDKYLSPEAVARRLIERL